MTTEGDRTLTVVMADVGTGALRCQIFQAAAFFGPPDSGTGVAAITTTGQRKFQR